MKQADLPTAHSGDSTSLIFLESVGQTRKQRPVRAASLLRRFILNCHGRDIGEAKLSSLAQYCTNSIRHYLARKKRGKGDCRSPPKFNSLASGSGAAGDLLALQVLVLRLALAQHTHVHSVKIERRIELI